MKPVTHVERAGGQVPVDGAARGERLLNALVSEVAERGYQATTVARISAAAGVSRTTFYDYFDDRQDCFLGAYRQLAARLGSSIAQRVEQRGNLGVTHALLGAIVEVAEREPNTAVVLFREPVAVGRSALEERNRLMSNIEGALERDWQTATTEAPVPTMPPRALVGAAARELALRLHRRQGPQDLLGELIDWSQSYVQRSPPNGRAAGEHVGWPSGFPPRARVPRHTASARQRRPAPERIVRAVAELTAASSYPQIGVADITSAAGVNRETFYKHFADKESAYVAALRLAFEGAFAATAARYFGAPDWTERVWNGMRGLVEFLDGERALAQIALSEPYAVGDKAVELIVEKQLAFSLFLDQGYRCRPGAEQISRATSNLVVRALFELLDRQLPELPKDRFSAVLPDAAYVALAPFTGADAAAAFVERKTARTR